MIKILFPIIIVFYTSHIFSQSLGKERIERAKKSTVRILIDNQPEGTGFIVSEKGQIVTCWHVIEPAIIRDSLNRIVSLKKIEAEIFSGDKVVLGIYRYLFQKGNLEAVGYDYCFLEIQEKVKNSYDFLKIGRFENINEGDRVFTIGYPFGIKQQFISTGFLSTKWVDTVIVNTNEKPDTLARNVAWLDLTMNKGNSGGAIIKIGKTPEEDVIIGIATFILNPFAKESRILSNLCSQLKIDILYSGISQVKVNKHFADAIANNSIGISGCISINHFGKIIN